MRRRLRELIRTRRTNEAVVAVSSSNPASRRPLGEVLALYPGQWVAVDRVSGEPVAAADSPYTLDAELRGKQIRNVAVVRAPDPSEPELVGFG